MSKTSWMEEEEKLFEKAWQSTAYGRDDLVQIFGRTYGALKAKARSLTLPTRGEIEARARIKAIREMLEKDHII